MRSVCGSPCATNRRAEQVVVLLDKKPELISVLDIMSKLFTSELMMNIWQRNPDAEFTFCRLNFSSKITCTHIRTYGICIVRKGCEHVQTWLACLDANTKPQQIDASNNPATEPFKPSSLQQQRTLAADFEPLDGSGI